MESPLIFFEVAVFVHSDLGGWPSLNVESFLRGFCGDRGLALGVGRALCFHFSVLFHLDDISCLGYICRAVRHQLLQMCLFLLLGVEEDGKI